MSQPKAKRSAQPLIIFSHGNSFPASTYGVLFDSLRTRGFAVEAIEKYGHDPAYPVTSNWPHLVQQLADFTGQRVGQTGQGAFLVGHSLGGFLSLMCAATQPVLAGQALRGVVLLDSPVIAGWRAAALSVAKRARLVGSLSPGALSQRRRNEWLSKEAVFDHFRAKKIFANWDVQTLHNYIEHGTVEAQPQDGSNRLLAFDRDIETAIYNTLPHNLDQILRAHPPKCPVAFIGGRESQEVRQVGMTATIKTTKGRVMMMDGTHLFPMERPLPTAAAIEAALLNMMA
jgi:pimeloyl-ACP methyl ester carboxylesterase